MSAEKKNIADLSAEELYALAREREQEEEDRREQEMKEKLDALKIARKEMLARHRKELSELDRQIRALGGSVPKARAGRTRRRSGSGAGTISQRLCEIVATQPEMTVSEIREQAEGAGIDTKNISQTLAYLKRQGRLASPRRGVYTSA
ncbi:hypothetical protein [Thioalkalivibrio sp.]|uniref:hypothetical protein n=1 Tax=Thioalkalivibrio sp. TaxID=2093813 RepID=UPI003974E5A7